MTKEITPVQAMQYLEMLVALDNTQIAKDTLEYYKHLEEENQKQKVILDILKERLEITISKQVDDYDDGIYLDPSESYYICEDTAISKNEYKLLKEWLDNDRV